MRIGGEVPGGGSNLLGGSKAMSEYGTPLPRIVFSMRRCRIVANSHLASGLVCGIAARTDFLRMPGHPAIGWRRRSPCDFDRGDH